MNLKTLFWTVSMQIFLLLASTLKGKLKLSVWNPRLRNALYQIFQSNLEMSLFEIWMNRSTCMMDIEVKNFLDPALGFYCWVCVCKKSFLCSCSVERKGYCISVIVFLYFNSKYVWDYQKKLLMRKLSKEWGKKSCQIALFIHLKNCYGEPQASSLILFFIFNPV